MARIKIMLVSCQPSFRALVRQALSQCTSLEIRELLECDPGDEGNNAIAEIRGNSPDLVLLDIGYPVFSGLKMGKKISRIFPKTGVIILSTNPEDDENELFEAARSGAAAYLRSKQPDGLELIKVIKRINNGECPISNDVINNPRVVRHLLSQFRDMTSVTGCPEAVASPLNPEEIQVLQLIAQGNQKQRIAEILGVSEQTITKCVKSVLCKLTNSDREHDMFIRSRKNMLSLQIARNGNLFIFDAPLMPGQPQPLCDAVPRQ